MSVILTTFPRTDKMSPCTAEMNFMWIDVYAFNIKITASCAWIDKGYFL